MKPIRALLMLAGTLAFSVGSRAAAPESFKGGPADLNKAVDARAAKLGKIAPADAPFAQLVKRVPRKGALIRVAFNDIGPVQRGGGQTAFIGRHWAAGAFDFALVTFPAAVEISTHSASVVVGSFAGTKEIAAANGSPVTVPVIEARVVGVIDGVTFVDGRPSFVPGSPIRVYEAPAKKAAVKKAGAKKP